jgi:hypothetical protein
VEALKNALRPLTNLLPQEAQDFLEAGGWWAVFAVVALIALLLLWALISRLAGALFGRKRRPEPDTALEENLAEYPPPVGTPGPRRLTVDGLPARLRLVVLAPIGRERPVDVSGLEALLDQVVRGLGGVGMKDRPRVRVWPPQLSNQAFAPTFHRKVRTPDREGRPSRWVLVAGPARAGGQGQVLLGLALLADEPNTLGKVTVQPGQWADTLRVQTVDS